MPWCKVLETYLAFFFLTLIKYCHSKWKLAKENVCGPKFKNQQVDRARKTKLCKSTGRLLRKMCLKKSQLLFCAFSAFLNFLELIYVKTDIFSDNSKIHTYIERLFQQDAEETTLQHETFLARFHLTGAKNKIK